MLRKDLTLADKISLLEKLKDRSPKTSLRLLEKITGVPRSTISRVLKNEQKLRDEWALRENTPGTWRKRKRKGKEPEVEDALNEWFIKESARDPAERGVRINGGMLKSKAEDIAKKMGNNRFKATDGWLSRWKARHEIKLSKVHVNDHEKWKALQFIADSWGNVGQKNSSQSCADCCGKKPKRGAESISEATAIVKRSPEVKLESALNCETFISVDDSIVCCSENSDSKEEIADRIVMKSEETTDDEEIIKVKSNGELARVTHREARKCISRLRLYFMQADNEGSPLSALDECAHFLESQSRSKRKYHTDNFFRNELPK